MPQEVTLPPMPEPAGWAPALGAENIFTTAQMQAYALQAVRDAVDEMTAAVMNGDLPIQCEQAADWLEKYAAAIQGQTTKESPNA